MELTILAIALFFTAVRACTPSLWGQGTCDYPLITASGNGPAITGDIAYSIYLCFLNQYGLGPYTIDGLTIPDASGQGNAWAVTLSIDGVSCNLCSYHDVRRFDCANSDRAERLSGVHRKPLLLYPVYGFQCLHRPSRHGYSGSISNYC